MYLYNVQCYQLSKFFPGPTILHLRPAWTGNRPGPPAEKTQRQVPPPKLTRSSALSAKQRASENFPRLTGKLDASPSGCLVHPFSCLSAL